MHGASGAPFETEVATMLQTAKVPDDYGRAQSLGRLRRRSRSITVRVLDGGREVDSFRASSPKVLRSALQPIETHLPRNRVVVQFRGVEEAWLPLGLDRVSHEVELDGLGSALSFLAA